MAKILLLDDSPVMHRVVRLTFADDASAEIAVARNPPEAELALSTSANDLVIAYVRFPGSVDLAYFQSIRKMSSRVLLLAESEENLDHFISAGFSAILRKPFHSDELRLAVEELLNGSGDHRKQAAIAGRGAPTPPGSLAPPATLSSKSAPTTSAPPVSKAPTPPPSSKPPQQPHSFPPITPVPQAEAATPGSFLTSESGSAGRQEETILTSRSAAAKPKAERTNSSIPPDSLAPTNPDEPQITMNLSFFKKPPAPPPPESNFGTIEKEEPPMATPVASARSIEPVQWIPEPLTLEDVMVSTRVGGQSQLSRSEVEKIVEQEVAQAVSKAVRQALNETLPDLRQALVNEVSQRAVAQLSAELQSIKVSLRESMLSEIRDLSAQWLRRETPSLAKDVIREEIRKVIEQI